MQSQLCPGVQIFRHVSQGVHYFLSSGLASEYQAGIATLIWRDFIIITSLACLFPRVEGMYTALCFTNRSSPIKEPYIANVYYVSLNMEIASARPCI